MEKKTRKKVAEQMVKKAVTVALVLLFLGSGLMRLLHFTPGALFIAGGIVLMLMALRSLIKLDESEEQTEKAEASYDPIQMAMYPLAVPYLLNPTGITVLITASSIIDSLPMFAGAVGIILFMGVLDMAVFKNVDKVAKHLDPARLKVTEAVFSVLLASLAVQLVLHGLEKSGIISGLPGN